MMLAKTKQNLNVNRQLFLLLSALVLFGIPILSHGVGEMNIPELDNPSISVKTSYDINDDRYTYNYIVKNPATSVGEIWRFKIDITQRSTNIWNYSGLKIPFGSKNLDFYNLYNKLQPFSLPEGYGITPVGQSVPVGWAGGFGRDGMIGFSSMTGTPMILPGQTLGGFSITSPGLPIIRQVEIIPNWVLVIENHDELTTDTELAANEVNKNIRRTTYSLGPAGVLTSGSFSHWNLLRTNINKAIELQWVSDQNLINDILLALKSARDAANLQEGKLAKSILEKLLITLANSSEQQRNQAFHDLLFYHVTDLIKYTADIPVRVEPKITATPSFEELSIGMLHTIKAKVVNLADENAPIEGYYLYFYVKDGPHIRTHKYADTDKNGEAIFQYIGKKVGKDHVVVEEAGW